MYGTRHCFFSTKLLRVTPAIRIYSTKLLLIMLAIRTVYTAYIKYMFLPQRNQPELQNKRQVLQ